jgi:hypothetical protein
MKKKSLERKNTSTFKRATQSKKRLDLEVYVVIYRLIRAKSPVEDG